MTTHLRHKVLAPGPRQTRDTYGAFAGDPQRLTLCGAEPTTRDMAWSEVRVSTSPNFAYVTCPECRALRFPAPDLGAMTPAEERAAIREANRGARRVYCPRCEIGHEGPCAPRLTPSH